jgi:hypothetical protein
MTLGHAWGAIVDHEISSMVSGFGLMMVSVVGQG